MGGLEGQVEMVNRGGGPKYMGVSENSVPLNPMVLLIIIPFLNGYFIGKINPIFRQTHIQNDAEMMK